MYKYVFKVEGMRCGMCETHVNDLIRRAVNAKTVKSSRVKGEAIIVSKEPVDKDAVINAVSKDGYKIQFKSEESFEKKGLFGLLKK